LQLVDVIRFAVDNAFGKAVCGKQDRNAVANVVGVRRQGSADAARQDVDERGVQMPGANGPGVPFAAD
jgi:hypothetical protein